MATLRGIRAEIDGLNEADRQALATEMAALLPPPPADDMAGVWRILLAGLMTGAVLAGIAAFLFYSGSNPTAGGAFLAITTTIIGALIGLIAPSPATKPR